jgi:1-acyl-sn-glycerol-3-phosphate acyltransferase
VNAAMAEAYRSGLLVLFFPEGTTTDGAGVLPFRRGLFHSILNDGVPLRTAALRYTLERRFVNRGATVGQDICWWGEMEFAPHMFALLGLQGLKAQIQFGEEVVQRANRFDLSEAAQARVAEMYEELGGAVSTAAMKPSETEVLEAILS